jgi:hypothetical protein
MPIKTLLNSRPPDSLSSSAGTLTLSTAGAADRLDQLEIAVSQKFPISVIQSNTFSIFIHKGIVDLAKMRELFGVSVEMGWWIFCVLL